MPQTPSQSRSSTYSHLLYLNENDRASYMATTDMARSTSSASARSSVSLTNSTASKGSTVASSLSSSYILSPKWADEHYPLITTTNPSSVPDSVPRSHSAFWIAREMAQIHNSIIRALNSSYNHALLVQTSTQEAADFLRFNQLIFTALHHHHTTEDDFLFPEIDKLLNRPGAMDENSKGHEAFAEGLALFEKYVFITKPAEFSGRTLRNIIESFAPDLIQHLHDEIPTLLSLHVLDSAQLKKLWTQAGKIATKDSTLHTDVPFLIGCQDRSFLLDGHKCTFPDMPWALEALVRNWHAKKHAGVWNFLPCDLSGKRRQLVPCL